MENNDFDENGMNVDIYLLPDGRVRNTFIRNIYPEDVKFFQNNDVKISMEEACGSYVLYADIGKKNEDGEPDELIVISGDMSCEDALNELRHLCESEIAKS